MYNVTSKPPTTSPLRGTPPRAGGEFSMPHGNLGAAPRCLPEEEYPEGWRWWEEQLKKKV